MPLKDILDSIGAEADREVAALGAEADQDVKGILDRADADVEALHRQCEERRQRYVDTIVARTIHAARLDAIRRAHAAHEAVAYEVLGQVREAVLHLRERPDYHAILLRWLAEVRPALPEGRRLLVAPDDLGAARSLAPDLDVAADPKLGAGLVLEAPDGRSAVATPEVRLARAEPLIRRSVARALPR